MIGLSWMWSLNRLFTFIPDRLMGGFLIIPACGRCQLQRVLCWSYSDYQRPDAPPPDEEPPPKLLREDDLEEERRGML